MNKTLKIIFCLSGFVVLFLGGVAVFNVSVDPMCYYRCDAIDLSRHTQNVYFQSAQMVAANPDAEILILGSSRGETTPPLWVQSVTGMKTINLSKGGTGLFMKLALLRMAAEYKLPLKKVIWIADYFELAGDVTDVKVRQTPVLRKHVVNELKVSDGVGRLKYYAERLQRLFDHNSFEASLQQLKNKEEDFFDPVGSGSKIEYAKCTAADYKGKISSELLPKAVDGSYSTFNSWLRSPLNQNFVEIFKTEISTLAGKGIEVIILVPPFHPEVLKRLKQNFPETSEYYKYWLTSIKDLESKNISVLSYWDGIPSDDGGPSFWDDGAHPTCKSMMLMLNTITK